MKKYIVIVLLAIGMAAGSSAQILSFGIKGGLNYSKMKFDNITNITVAAKSYKLMEDKSFQGFHIGVMGRVKVFNLFVQPELLFNTTGGKVLIEEIQGATTVSTVKQVKYNKLDLPVLVGMKFGPARINIGPVASVVLSSKSEISEIIPDMKTMSKGATIGFQAGAGLDLLKKFTLDLRYEAGLSKLGDKLTVAGQNYAFDSRDSKFLVSVGYFF
jgi:hypothetical protein